MRDGYAARPHYDRSLSGVATPGPGGHAPRVAVRRYRWAGPVAESVDAADLKSAHAISKYLIPQSFTELSQNTPAVAPATVSDSKPIDTDLAHLTAVWPDLPEAIRAAIAAMVESLG